MKKKNKQLRNLLICVAVILSVITILASVVFVDSVLNDRPAKELSVEEAQSIVNSKFDSLPAKQASAALWLGQNSNIVVDEIRHGEHRELILSCTYNTKDVYTAVNDNVNEILTSVEINDSNGRPKNATKIKLELKEKMTEILADATDKSGKVEIYLYETINDGFKVYLSDELVNTVYGGLIDAVAVIDNTTSVKIYDESGKLVETKDISAENTLRSGCTAGLELVNYSKDKPDTSTFVGRTWNSFKADFHRNFIFENRWTYLVKGLGTTLAITALSLVLGVVIGVIVAMIRCTFAKTGKLGIPDKICNVYLSIVRGTPVMVQLMIIYFVLLLPIGIEKFPAAVICFGVNSGAYVAEIIRGGIMSIDDGQMEAGRSLGLGYIPTMWHIIIPQAFKAILPSLANEFITLLKETSVAFYIGVSDLTQGGLKIRSLTYSNFMPLIAVALIYLVLVLGLSYLVSLLERRLRKSDRR